MSYQQVFPEKPFFHTAVEKQGKAVDSCILKFQRVKAPREILTFFTDKKGPKMFGRFGIVSGKK